VQRILPLHSAVDRDAGQCNATHLFLTSQLNERVRLKRQSHAERVSTFPDLYRVKNEVINLNPSSSLVFRIFITPKTPPKTPGFGDESVTSRFCPRRKRSVQTNTNKNAEFARAEEVRLRTNDTQDFLRAQNEHLCTQDLYGN
jgi:hypothetical protein